jgi:hypothetical protein
MIAVDRYLHFDNIDMEQPSICSRCSHCGQAFKAEPQAGERVEDVLLRIRRELIRINARRRSNRLHRDRI